MKQEIKNIFNDRIRISKPKKIRDKFYLRRLRSLQKFRKRKKYFRNLNSPYQNSRASLVCLLPLFFLLSLPRIPIVTQSSIQERCYN